jgi:hypothetical protein
MPEVLTSYTTGTQQAQGGHNPRPRQAAAFRVGVEQENGAPVPIFALPGVDVIDQAHKEALAFTHPDHLI